MQDGTANHFYSTESPVDLQNGLLEAKLGKKTTDHPIVRSRPTHYHTLHLGHNTRGSQRGHSEHTDYPSSLTVDRP